MKFSIVYKLGLSAILIVLISTGVVGTLFYTKTTELLLKEAVEDIAGEIYDASNRLQAHIIAQREDTLVLANIPPIQGMLRSLKSNNYDEQGKSTYQQWVQRLQIIFKTMLASKAHYIKIQFIDRNGLENVVATRDGDNIVVLNEKQMQNKLNRLYTSETLKLPVGSVFLSDIHLNHEHGNVSEPHQEVLQSSTPIYDELHGEMAGFLVVTAEVGTELRAIQKSVHHKSSTIYITNDHGGYLLHPETSKSS